MIDKPSTRKGAPNVRVTAPKIAVPKIAAPKIAVPKVGAPKMPAPKKGAPPAIAPKSRVDASHVRERLTEYARLARMDRPVGALLLLWPTWWALWLAAQDFPPIST